MKILRCSDLGFNCEAVVRADTEQDVLRIAAQHDKQEHWVNVTPEMAEQFKTKIKEEELQTS